MSTDAYVLNGYRLTNLMMTGQTSQVWEAMQEITGRRYALKMLLPERAREPEHRKYIDTEAKVANRILLQLSRHLGRRLRGAVLGQSTEQHL